MTQKTTRFACEVFKPSTNQTYKVPAGTEVIFISGSNEYAVKHATECGMSEHDARHYYLFVPKKAFVQ